MPDKSPPVAALLLAAALAGCGPGYTVLPPGQESPGAWEAEITTRMIDAIREISLQRNPQGTLLRFNQAKSLGCLDATFTVKPDLPPALREGVFAEPRSYPARLRFASATEFDDREKDFRGLSIKLSGVSGEPLWGQPGEQDFIFNSHPVLFAGDPADFLDFIEASRDDSLWRYFLNPSHFYSLRIILGGREKIDNPFAIRYWSTTPYRYGDDPATAVKYSVRPCPGSDTPAPVERHENFLSEAMSAQLAGSTVCLEFMVQFQTDPEQMPVENAAVEWDEATAPFTPVATLTIEDQDFMAQDRSAACESLRFNPWQSLAAHRPLGGINRVRKPVYSEIGEFRLQENRAREAK